MAHSNWLVVASTVTLLCAPVVAAPSLELKVVGTARLQARATATSSGAVAVQGVLDDERAEPLPIATVDVSPSLSGGQLEKCPGSVDSILSSSVNGAKVTTDPQGRFCVLWTAPEPGVDAAFAVRFAGSNDYQPAGIRVTIDRQRRTLALRFAPTPRELALEQPVHVILIDTDVVQNALPAELAETISVSLALEEAGRPGALPLGSTTIRAGETARLELKAEQLRGAGPATLLASSPGAGSIEGSQTRLAVLRTAAVTLSPLASNGASRAYEDPIAVETSAPGLNQPRGAVELLLPGIPALTAPLISGHAVLHAPQSQAHKGKVRATLRYLPDGPEWKPGDPLHLDLTVSPPSRWRHAPWALAALGVAAWLAKSWRRPRAQSKPHGGAPPTPRGVPELQVLTQGGPRDGWLGLVADAHDGRPIADASVMLQLPHFSGLAANPLTTTASDGTFALEHIGVPEGTRLVVSARLYSLFERPAPPPGILRISLVTHRRELLDSLVAWVRRSSRTWRLSDDPTPAELRRKARALEADSIALWALETERVAFGPEPATLEAARRVGDLGRQVEPTLQAGLDQTRRTKTSPPPFQR